MSLQQHARTATIRLALLAGEEGKTLDDERYMRLLESLVDIHVDANNVWPKGIGLRYLREIWDGFQARAQAALAGGDVEVDEFVHFVTASWTNAINPGEARSYLASMRAKAAA
jgi:hypothetical protein